MSVQSDQMLYKYLSDVGDRAQGVLSHSRRAQLVSSLRSRIEAERDRLGITSAAGMRALLDQVGSPEMVVNSAAHSDPEYQQRLSDRLSTPTETFAGTRDVVLDPTVPSDGTPRPQIPLDVDPFAALAERPADGVAPIAMAEAAPAVADTATTATLPPLGDVFQTVSNGPLPSQDGSVWRQQPPVQLTGRLVRTRPREAVAMGLLLFALIFGFWLPLGSWIPLIIGYLVALTSYVFTPTEKRFALIGVPVATLVVVSFGFWLHDTGAWGGTRVSHADVVGQGGMFLGTVPRIIAVFALLYFGWRLARRITRDGL